MTYANEKKMYQKYADVLAAVSKANPQGEEKDGSKHYVDQSIALTMMEQAVKSGDPSYMTGVPADFDWKQFEHDLTHGIPDEE